MSVGVISLVVWLVLVFLSVTAGIEKNWHQKLTSLHAPIRISPTDPYYASYYYQIDGLAAASNFTLKTVGEKQLSPLSDPYAVDLDAEVPFYWPKADRAPSGTLRDPVKLAIQELAKIPHIAFQDYEIGGALLRLNLRRSAAEPPASLSQMSYLLSLTEENPHFRSLVLDSGSPMDFDEPPETPPQSVYFVKGKCHLPEIGLDTPVLLPKNYRENGVQIGDKGALSYSAPTAASSQEQRIPIRVVGFYDPGIMSVGNKCLIVPTSVTRSIHAVSQTFSPDGTPTNGLFVWTEDLSQTQEIKAKIAERFAEAGISNYWKIASYDEFEFSKDLMLQFRSDRTLFLLIAIIILVVACSNIISLLVLLVNDKKKEIAILQSMGASFLSIASIFGICGISMGAISCLLGGSLALFTLKHLDSLVAFLSAIQGHAAFNPAFFGQTLPNEFSFEALLFVLIATPILSLAAGLIPAFKASRIRPSSVLRSE
ncbi:MAG TPA: FtsX-like permease family protein [Chlamydiales bacterium]|nr:FtsX-like permease family protein [Chlamydiales bacterium]